MADRQVTVRLRAEIGGFKAAMAEAGASSRKASSDMKASWSDTGSITGNAIQASQKYADSWHQVSNAATIGGTAIVGALGLAVSKYADFDAAMSNVKASTHESAENMQLLREAALSAGKDTAYSATEAAGAIDELAKAGISTKDILGGGLKGALSLAAAGQMEVGDAAEIAATAMTQFGLKGSDVGHVADLLAAGAGKAQGSVTDMGYALKQSGLVASQAGISLEETTGTLAAFASAGLIGSDAGTSFKSMLQHLQNPSKEAASTMKELGISMYDSQGNFVGMANLAEQLKTSMEGLTPAQRDAAMATIFGSDAVRAANVLYAQGGSGIQDWINKVNDAGYAAETAAIKQDNLKGDLEKLSGAFETVFLSAGGAGNDALRTLVQSLTGVVDAVGRVPAPVLEATGLIIGLGGAAIAGAGLIMKGVSAYTVYKDVLSSTKDIIGLFKNESNGLATNVDLATGTMERGAGSANKYGAAIKAATAATLLLAAGSLDFFSKDLGKVFHDGADAAGQFGDESSAAVNKVSDAFKSADWANGNAGTWSAFLDGTADGVNNVGDAVNYMNSTGGFRNFNESLNEMFGNTTALKSMKDDISSLDAGMAQLASGGNLQQAQAMFQQFADQTVKAGGTIGDMTNSFPQLISAVQQYGESLGVSLSAQEATDVLMGNMPPKLQAAAESSKAAADGLAQIGASAQSAATPLKDVVDAMSALGLAQMSMTEAQGAYSQSVRDLGAALAENAFQLNANGTAFDVTTQSGYAAQQAFNAVAQAGFDMVSAMANNGASQAELQGALQQTYTDLVNNGTQFGLTAAQADTLARATLGIPPNVDIETWMSDNAKNMAESTDKAVENIPDSHHTDSSMSPNAHNEADNTTSAIKNIPGSHHTDSSMSTLGRLEANSTKTSVENIPNSKHTSLTASSDARDMANQTKEAIWAIPMSKTSTITVNTMYTESSLGRAVHKASGGLVSSGVRGYAGGGRIPGRRPDNILQDNLWGIVGDTGELIRVQSTEFITRSAQVSAGDNLKVLEWMNRGGVFKNWQGRGFAEGGSPALAGIKGFSNDYRFNREINIPQPATKEGMKIEQIVMNTPQATDPNHYAVRASETFSRIIREVL